MVPERTPTEGPAAAQRDDIAGILRSVAGDVRRAEQGAARVLAVANAVGLALVTYVAIELRVGDGRLHASFGYPLLAFLVGALAGIAHDGVVGERLRQMYAHLDERLSAMRDGTIEVGASPQPRALWWIAELGKGLRQVAFGCLVVGAALAADAAFGWQFVTG